LFADIGDRGRAAREILCFKKNSAVIFNYDLSNLVATTIF
jgi:hypothetical protein